MNIRTQQRVSLEHRLADRAQDRLPIDLWQSVAEAVRRYAPRVVVLVARKAPRLHEVLGLDFGSDALITSDLALPFVASHLRGARVAIVDDIINRGTTVAYAAETVTLLGAAEHKVFAVARSKRAAQFNPWLASKEPLDRASLQRLAQQVPQVIALLSRPFDMSFPTLRCELLPPYGRAEALYARLESEFGSDAVAPIPSAWGQDSGMHRFTVTLDGRASELRKLRFYVDEGARLCSLVPMAVPCGLGTEQELIAWLRASAGSEVCASVERALADCPSRTTDVLGQIRLFLGSSNLGRWALRVLGDVLTTSESGLLDDADASLAFGPELAKQLLEEIGAPNTKGELDPVLTSRQSGTLASDAPLSARAPFDNEVTGRMLAAAYESGGLRTLLTTAFEALAQQVGSEEPGAYSLAWPYTRAAVRSNEYLRLRVGFTFADLVEFCRRASGALVHDAHKLRQKLSILLDELIDSGAVVPTLGCYEGIVYRVYRAGEAAYIDRVLYRTAYALDGLELSDTRAAKIGAILALSGVSRSLAHPRAAPFGNVAAYPRSPLTEDDAELVFALRRHGLRSRH